MGKNTVEAQVWFEKRYPDFSPSKPMICRYYAEFNLTDINDAELSGRLLKVVKVENMSVMLKTVMQTETNN